MNKTITIAIDCFGGDFAPKSTVGGVITYLSKHKKNNKNVNFLLFGNETKIKSELSKYKKFNDNIKIIHTDNVIPNCEKPSVAVRKGKNSSMWLAIEAVKNGDADACISAGNTGALMALSKLILKPLIDIDRPALIQILPTEKNRGVAFLDLGANIECSSEHLYQFAVMGYVFFEAMTNNMKPKIGLLNIGTEDIKGNEIIKNTVSILKESCLKDNFYGYVEGNDIFKEKVDVIVCDGFVGNIALKTLEGTVKFLFKNLISAIKKNILALFGFVFTIPAMLSFKRKINPDKYNGALFIGLNGISVKSHGNANDKSFCYAIENAIKIVNGDINNKIISLLSDKIIDNEESNK